MPETHRATSERRSGKDRRSFFNIHRLIYNGQERRANESRRLQGERRAGWVRINKWSSVNLQDLKISRYVH